MELEDDYEHISKELFYITENIRTEGLNEEYEEQIQRGCACEEQCTFASNCTCLAMSGAVYIRNKDSRDVHDSYFIEEIDTQKPIFECNTNCKCVGSVCGNRLVQFGPAKNLQITDLGEKGFGLITTAHIKKGSFICEYAGEIISESEAKTRYARNKTLGTANYIFCVNEYFGDKNHKTYIDPSVFGNIGRYINHSCQPNCALHPIRVDNIIPKLCVFAKSDIAEFAEITFDYGTDASDNVADRVACFCNSPCCRKYLPYCPKV